MNPLLIIPGIVLAIGAGIVLLCYFSPRRGRIFFNIFRSPFDWLGEGCQTINRWIDDQVERLTGERNIRLGYLVGSIIIAIITLTLMITGAYAILSMLPALGLQVSNLDWLYEKYPFSIIMAISIIGLPIFFGIITFDLLGKTNFIHWKLFPRLRKIFLTLTIICIILSLILACLLGGLRNLLISEAYASTLTEEITQGEILSVDEQEISNLKDNQEIKSHQSSAFGKIRGAFYIIFAVLEFTAIALGFFSLWFSLQYIIVIFLKMFVGIVMFILRLPVYLIELLYNLLSPTPVQEDTTSLIQQPHEITATQPVYTPPQQHTPDEKGHFDSEIKRDFNTNESRADGYQNSTFLPGLEEPLNNEKERSDKTKRDFKTNESKKDVCQNSTLLPGLEEPLNKVKECIAQLQLHKEQRVRSTEGILIEGTPKCGKTALLEALQKDLPTLLFLRASDFTGISDEEIKRRIIELIGEITTQQDDYTTLVIDDIDCICGTSQESSNYLSSCGYTFTNTLISLFDEPINQETTGSLLIIIAAAKSSESLPQELRSKFSQCIHLDLPDNEARRNLIHRWLTPYLPLSKDQENQIIDNTQGYNYSALQSLCQKILLPQTDESIDNLISEALQNTTPTTKDTKLEFLEPLNIEQIGGYSEIVAELRKLAQRFKNREEYKKRNVKLPKGILFYGPPGTGKTCLARIFATLLGYRCIKVDSEKIGSPYIYQAERNLAQVFKIAQSYTPTLLVMDELETLARKRGSSMSSEAYEGVVGVLLRHLDGLDTCQDMFVVGITNRKDMIDEAVLRSGRIGEHIEVGLPDAKSRRAVFEVHIKNKRLKKAEDIDLDEISTLTAGFNCADIANIVDESSANAIDEAKLQNKEPILTRRYLLEVSRNIKKEGVDKDENISL